jgi:hypothetical protein
MAEYAAPVKDMQFVLKHVVGLDQVNTLPGCEEVTADVVDAILEEASKFAGEVLSPLNAIGDKIGAVLKDGVVTTPPGFKDAYWQFVNGGWGNVVSPPEYGGQGLPILLSTPIEEMWGSANLAFKLCPMLTLGAVEALHRNASQELKQRFLPNMVSGKWTGTMNLTEPQAGSDLSLVRTKALPQAEIRGYQPYQGVLTIKLAAPADVRVRIPEWVSSDEMRVEATTGPVAGRAWGNYLHLGLHAAGEQLRISYPLAEYTEEESIGNPGWRQYRYRAAWRGDTVMEMTPLGNDHETGWSDFDNREVPVFYGEAGPGRLYQRKGILGGREPEPADLHIDDGSLDFWYGLG